MELFALDGINQIAPIHSYESVKVTERDLDTGAWELVLSADDEESVASQLAAATWPGFEIHDPDTGWRFGGFVRKIRETRTPGRRTVTFVGNDFQTELQNRLEWPVFDELGFWWQNVYGGTIPLTSDAHNTVRRNCGPEAFSYRQIPNLTFGANPDAGTPKARRIKGIPVLEVLRGLFTGEEWTARLRLRRDIGIDTTSSLEFTTPTRPLAEAVLSLSFGNLGEVELVDEADTATFVVGMGSNFGPSERYISAAHPPAFAQSWRDRHVETFINRPGTDNQLTLIDEVTTRLGELEKGRSVTIDGAQIPGFGATVDIGWNIQVDVGSSFGATRLILPVTGSALSFTPANGWRRTIDVGQHPAANSPASMLALVGELGRRVRQLESELTT